MPSQVITLIAVSAVMFLVIGGLAFRELCSAGHAGGRVVQQPL